MRHQEEFSLQDNSLTMVTPLLIFTVLPIVTGPFRRFWQDYGRNGSPVSLRNDGLCLLGAAPLEET